MEGRGRERGRGEGKEGESFKPSSPTCRRMSFCNLSVSALNVGVLSPAKELALLAASRARRQ